MSRQDMKGQGLYRRNLNNRWHHEKRTNTPPEKAGDKDWREPCYICGGIPTVHPTRLCGPCHFGDPDTIHGKW